MRRSLAALVGLLSFAALASGQQKSPSEDTITVRMSRWLASFAVEVGQPVGGFKRNVNNAVGGQAHLLLRLNRKQRPGFAAVARGRLSSRRPSWATDS